MSKMIRLSLLLIQLFSLTTLAQQNVSFAKPPLFPELVAPGFISTGLGERDFALSPDETEIFYTLQSPQGLFQTILQIKRKPDGTWGKPEVAPFAGNFSDLEPAFSPDGNKLFFSSNRPLSGNEIKDFDIWVVEKLNGEWGNPKNIGSPVNTGEDEFYPSITNSGNLYFTAAYKNAVGKEDIYVAQWQSNKYIEPVPLDTAVNSKTYEFNAFVSPAEDYIIFTSYGRKDDKGRGDLYISTKDAGGKWRPAINLAMLNSDKLDYCPFLDHNKKNLFFTSERHSIKRSFTGKPVKAGELVKAFTTTQNGGGDIYRVSFETLLKSIDQQ